MVQVQSPALPSAQDVLRHRQQPLAAFFTPGSVAVIGATEAQGSVGRTVLANLSGGAFQGRTYPVNPKRSAVLGLQAYPNVAAIPEPVDLAVIVTPAKVVPGIIQECIDAGVRAAVIISAGFREAGPAGEDLEGQIREKLLQTTMRVIGPNCLGVMCPRVGLNATFAAGMCRMGNVAFLSQSGALLTAILDWSRQENVGFSAFVSVGSMLDVGWGALIDYFCDDPHTQSIMIYMESIGDARSFLSAAREVTLRKPVIVIKAGRTEAAARAAASHTGALTGSDDVLEAAFRRTGVLRVRSIAELFNMAEVLAKQPRPRGPRLTILTNAGGPGVLATDALISTGGQLAGLGPLTLTALDKLLPQHWSHGNPIDILGDAEPERYAGAIEIAARDAGSDGLLVILTPQDMTDPTQTAERLKPLAAGMDKPLLASWMGGPGVAAGVEILNQAGIPTYAFPDTAARTFTYMWQYSYNLHGLYETPSLAPEEGIQGDAAERAERIIQTCRASTRTLLTELESKELMAAYGIPTVPTLLAQTEDEAVLRAEALGWPVVVKLHSQTITHKTDVGGVKLNLQDESAVRQAYQSICNSVGSEDFLGVTVQPMIKLEGYECILGSSIDPQFGPVILFGTGGQLVEVFRDRGLALPPLNSTLARRLMEQTRIFAAFKGVRGRRPIDVPALEQLLIRFSRLVVEQKWIKEIDINPLLVSAERLVALDARVLLHDPEMVEAALPRFAIRPYPTQYVSQWNLPDGTPVTIRPICPEDEPLMARFHVTLSEQSVFLRYLQVLKLSTRVAHDRLARLCFIDYDREMALVAVHCDAATGTREILGVGRLITLHGRREAEYAILVGDRYQRSGLGTELLRRLLQVARAENLQRVFAYMLPENIGMQRVSAKLGLKVGPSAEGDLIYAEIDLAS